MTGDALHHADGSHRTTARTANGTDVERHEAAITAHTADGHRHGVELVAPVPAFLARCYGCGRTLDSAREPIYADLDGPPFLAYYDEAHRPDRAGGRK